MHFPVLGVDAKLPLETLTLPQLIGARKQKNKQANKTKRTTIKISILWSGITETYKKQKSK